MKAGLFSIVFLIASVVHAQKAPMFTANADSSKLTLTPAGASHLASLPLKCILQEYPNKINHTAVSDSDQVLTPRQQHPSFYGCFDWHSSVHGHWMLVSLLKQFPQLPEAAQIRASLSKNLSVQNLKQEVNYFNSPLTKSFERTYGWAWLLKLQQEIMSWNDAEAKKWQLALQPLCDTVVQIWMRFLPKQTYPNRTGVHPNTAFGLVFALEYARYTHNTAFESAIVTASKRLFGNDKLAPAVWEPDGSDFLSPSLEEADLMRRVLGKSAFVQWFNQWITPTALQRLTQLPVVSDRNDLQIVHLDGLCFSRSWCMRGIAQLLPDKDPRKKILLRSAVKHLNASLPNIASGSYGGEHWLASFAVYALSQEQ
jgi:hypothetical protein